MSEDKNQEDFQKYWESYTCALLKPKVGPNILPLCRVYHIYWVQPLILPHFSTQNHDKYHGTIGYDLIEIHVPKRLPMGPWSGNKGLYGKCLFPTPIQDNGFARLETSISDRSWKHTVLTPKRRDQPWTKLLKGKAHEILHPSLLPTHTYWCGPPVNGEYQHWLQPMALTG